MKITKLQKEANYLNKTAKITVEITVEASDLACFDYEGWDMIPDECIPDILLAVSRMYAGCIKKGKLLQEKVSSLIRS